MGQLEAGAEPLSWKDAKALAAYIKKHGILQLINIFHRLKDRVDDKLQWGDEVCALLGTGACAAPGGSPPHPRWNTWL